MSSRQDATTETANKLVTDLPNVIGDIRQEQSTMQEAVRDSRKCTEEERACLLELGESHVYNRRDIDEMEKMPSVFQKRIGLMQKNHSAELMAVKQEMIEFPNQQQQSAGSGNPYGRVKFDGDEMDMSSQELRRHSAPTEAIPAGDWSKSSNVHGMGDNREGPRPEPVTHRQSIPSIDTAVAATWWDGNSVHGESGNRNEPRPEPPLHRQLFPDTQTIICDTITKPPTFREDHFEDYKRAVGWWIQLQPGISSERLLAAIGVYEQGPVKWVLNAYFSATKNDPSGRAAEGFMAMMDTRFNRSAEDLVLNKLGQWGDLKRKKGEDVRMFWIRFGRLRGQGCVQ